MFELCLIGIFSLLKFNDTINFIVSLGDYRRVVHIKLVNLLKVRRRCDTPRFTTMISIDGRLRGKSNAKVAMNESRDANAKENELLIEQIANNRRWRS